MIQSDKNLILLHPQAKDRQEVIRQLCKLLEEQGCVGPSYCQAVLDREEQYPTGLPSEGAVAAIPHALSKDVQRTAVAVAVLKDPVIFRNISDYEEELEAKLVFLLANAEGAGDHMDTLQDLMGYMSRPQLLLDLRNAESADAVAEILARADSYPEE